MSYEVTKARIYQWIGIILLVGVFAGVYWYFSVRAGVKSNTSAGQPQGGSDLTAGLALYWPLDDASGSVADDKSTNGNDGTLTGGPSFTAGQIGGAVDFDGSDDSITLADPSSGVLDFYPLQYGPNLPGDVLTLSAWFNRDTATTDDTIIAKKNSYTTNADKGYVVWIDDATDEINVRIDGNYDANGSSSASSTTYAATGWHHLVVVIDEQRMARTNGSRQCPMIFVDGVDVTDLGTCGSYIHYVGDISNSVAFTVGAESDGGNPFDGKLDDIRVYNRVMVEADIAALYSNTVTTSGIDTSLKGYWSFDAQDTGSSVAPGNATYDRSGAGNTGTLNGSPTITSGVVGQGLSFDGVDDNVRFLSNEPTITGALTASFWIKTTATSFKKIFGFWSTTGWMVDVDADGSAPGKISFYSSNSGYKFASTAINDGVWHHVAITLDSGGALTIYQDGIPNATYTSVPLPGSYTSDKFIGANPGGGQYFPGSLDEMRIYNRALTASEIKGLYDIAKPDTTNSASSQAQGTGRLDSGLAGYWKFDDGSGTTATDASTNGNNATLTGATQTWVTGQIGSALDFNGLDDIGTVPYSASLTSSTALSYSFWIQPDLNDENGFLGSLNGEDGSGYNFIRIDNSGTEAGNPRLTVVRDINGVALTRAVQFVYPVSTWFHGVYTYDGAYERLYINGNKLGEWAQTGSFATNTEYGLVFGKKSSSIGTEYDGALDEIRMYNRSLSSDEVTQLYRLTTPTTVDTSLKGYWSFNGQDMSGTTAYDRSGAGNTGTLTGGPVIVEGLAGQAASFDGTDAVVTTSCPSSLSNATVSFWAKTNGSGGAGNKHPFDIRDNLGGSSVIAFRSGAADDIFIRNAGGTTAQITTLDYSLDNTWHQYVATIDGTNLIAYKDGISSGSVAWSSSLTGIDNCYIGDSNGTDAFAGSVDEVRVYTRALTASEIKSMYDVAVPDKTNSSVTQPQGTGRLDSGLAGYWKLDDGSGTTATDVSTNGNNGTLTNSPAWTAGRVSGAVIFDGTDDYISIPDSSALEGTSSLSFGGWIKRNGAQPDTGFGTSVCKLRTTGIGQPVWCLFIKDTGARVRMNTSLDDDTGNFWEIGNDFVTGEWHHIMVTWSSGGKPTFYFDGVAQSLSTDAGTLTGTLITSADGAYIGAAGASALRFKGSLDETRVYSRALSADEVSQIYRLNSSTGTDTSLKGYWSFNGKDLSGTTAYDRSGVGNNGTLTGSPAITEGKLGQGIDFDGVDDYMVLSANNLLNFGDGDFSLSGWFNRDTFTTADVILAKRNHTGYAESGYMVDITTGDNLVFRASDGVDEYILTSSAKFETPGWHYFTIVWGDNSTGTTLYVDGQPDTSTATAGSLSAIGNLDHTVFFRLGTSSNGQDPFDGKLDEVRAYNRALSSGEVLGLYNQSR